ncbi:MAG: LysR substrate-binding domain-containing protein [Sneathiellaceae bacterium]
MNLRDLRYVCAVAEHRHFGRAAEACHVSQPTLSGQIRKLEVYLGVDLFERSNRIVRPTPVGEEIAARARILLQQAAEIERLAQAGRDPEAGALRLGMIATVAPALLPLCLPALRRRFPRLHPGFVEDLTDILLRRLADGELDGAVIATDPGDAGLKCLPLYSEPFLVAMPKDHPLATAERVAVADLKSVHLLLLTDGHCLRDQALEVCAMAVPPGQIDTSATSLETLVNLVGAGLGLTLVPALSVRPGWSTDPGIVCRPLDEAAARREVRLAYRTGFPRQSLLQQVAATIREVVPTALVTPGE